MSHPTSHSPQLHPAGAWAGREGAMGKCVGAALASSTSASRFQSFSEHAAWSGPDCVPLLVTPTGRQGTAWRQGLSRVAGSAWTHRTQGKSRPRYRPRAMHHTPLSQGCPLSIGGFPASLAVGPICAHTGSLCSLGPGCSHRVAACAADRPV